MKGSMMKKLICTTVFSLAFISSISAVQATGVRNDMKVPHIVSSAANPNNSRFLPATYYFNLHVAGRALEQLSINAPAGVGLNERIEVKDQSGKKLNTTVSLNGQRATIAFAQPVVPDTLLKVTMNQVNAPSNSHIWIFPLSSKLVGLASDIPLGSVRVQTPSL